MFSECWYCAFKLFISNATLETDLSVKLINLPYMFPAMFKEFLCSHRLTEPASLCPQSPHCISTLLGRGLILNSCMFDFLQCSLWWLLMFLVHSKCDVVVWLKTYLDIFVVLADVGRLEFTLTAKVSQSNGKSQSSDGFKFHMRQYHSEQTLHMFIYKG